jgi:hypothetical protein
MASRRKCAHCEPVIALPGEKRRAEDRARGCDRASSKVQGLTDKRPIVEYGGDVLPGIDEWSEMCEASNETSESKRNQQFANEVASRGGSRLENAKRVALSPLREEATAGRVAAAKSRTGKSEGRSADLFFLSCS